MSGKLPIHQVIRGGRVLDIPARAAILADILIAGDTIAEVGPPGMAAPAGAREIKGEDRLLIPGLVNAHTHGNGSLGRGLGDRWTLELLLNASPWVNGGLEIEDKRLAARLNAAEMVLKGCTAAYDLFLEIPAPSREGIVAAGQGYADVGVRVVLAPMMQDILFHRAIPGLLEALPEPERRQAEDMRAAPFAGAVATCRDLLDDWPFDRLCVRPALGPTIPLHCSDEFLTACRDLARDFDVGIQMHLAESKVQALSGIARYGRTLAAHLDRLGLLGPHFTGAHGVWLGDDDLRLLRDRGAGIAHNPGSNLRLGSGIAPAREMIDLAIPVGIGTDGSASSDNQNMFAAMRAAAFVSRVVTPDPSRWMETWEVLRLATEGGAHALGMGGVLGRLAPGYKADIVFLDLGNVNFVPLNDAANQIVNCEDGSAVDSVIIGGRMVLAGRQFTTIDYDRLRQDVQATADRLRPSNAAAKIKMEAIAPFVSQYCVGLSCQPYPVRRQPGSASAD